MQNLTDFANLAVKILNVIILSFLCCILHVESNFLV